MGNATPVGTSAPLSRRPTAEPQPVAVGPKLLRVGVIQGGKIIEEKLLRRHERVTIGSGTRNTLVIPASGLPESLSLFEPKGSHYELSFTDTMSGRISVRDAVHDLAGLKSANLARRSGKGWSLPLTDEARGKVSLGDVTVLFQFVVAPPEPEKPKLPASAKGSLWTSIDWFLTVLLLVSSVLHTSLVVAFYNTPLPEPLGLEEMDERWAKLLVPDMQREEKPKEPPKEKPKTDGTAAAAAAEKEKLKVKDDMNESQKAAVRAARKEAAAKLVAGKGVLAILGTAGAASAGGVVADVFGQGGIGVREGAFDGITGIGVADGGGERTRRGASDVGSAASIGDLATSGGGDVATSAKQELKVGVVKSERPEVDGALDPDAIARFVKTRIASVKDCYERELKRNPQLAGKVAIAFTIEESGRVSEAEVETNTMGSDTVASCIAERIKRWVFPKPKGGSVTVSYPFIFSPAG